MKYKESPFNREAIQQGDATLDGMKGVIEHHNRTSNEHIAWQITARIVGRVIGFNLSAERVYPLLVYLNNLPENKTAKSIEIAGKQLTQYNDSVSSGHITRDQFWNGIRALLRANVIARADTRGFYFLNPSLIFAGDLTVITNYTIGE